jgi:hypothetical protein
MPRWYAARSSQKAAQHGGLRGICAISTANKYGVGPAADPKSAAAAISAGPRTSVVLQAAAALARPAAKRRLPALRLLGLSDAMLHGAASAGVARGGFAARAAVCAAAVARPLVAAARLGRLCRPVPPAAAVPSCWETFALDMCRSVTEMPGQHCRAAVEPGAKAASESWYAAAPVLQPFLRLLLPAPYCPRQKSRRPIPCSWRAGGEAATLSGGEPHANAPPLPPPPPGPPRPLSS